MKSIKTWSLCLLVGTAATAQTPGLTRIRCSEVVAAAHRLGQLPAPNGFKDAARILAAIAPSSDERRLVRLNNYIAGKTEATMPDFSVVQAVNTAKSDLYTFKQRCATAHLDSRDATRFLARSTLIGGSALITIFSGQALFTGSIPPPLAFFGLINGALSCYFSVTDRVGQGLEKLDDYLPAWRVNLEEGFNKLDAALESGLPEGHTAWWGFSYRGWEFDWGVAQHQGEKWAITAFRPRRR